MSAIVIWVVIISPVPVTASVYLIAIFCLKPSHRHSAGVFKISLDGYFEWVGKTHVFKASQLIFKPFCVVIYDDRGSRLIVWRDACEEVEYRHLLVILKLLHQKRRGEQFPPL